MRLRAVKDLISVMVLIDAIPHLFTDSEKAAALGMSAWHTARLNALYHTQHGLRSSSCPSKPRMEIALPPDSNHGN